MNEPFNYEQIFYNDVIYYFRNEVATQTNGSRTPRLNRRLPLWQINGDGKRD
jgi:hypothetical protein